MKTKNSTKLHELPATRETVSVGVIDRNMHPVIEVESGDEVLLETWTHWGDVVRPETTYEDFLKFRQMHRNPSYPNAGPHSLTGPIAVKGAKPGLALRVDILDICLRNHGYNVRLSGESGRGLLPEDFPNGEIKHFTFDLQEMTTEFLPGIQIPLRPFLGIMAVAPPGSNPISSSTVGTHGGNIDLTDLTVGSSLFLPVWKDGADFRTGDAHAVQGDGEVNLMAIETAFTSARLRFTVCERLTLRNPWAENPNHFITFGFGCDLQTASKEAVREMISFLGKCFSLSPSEAYTLCSIAVDLSITQIVNPYVGVHAKLSRAIFDGGKYR